MFFLQYKIELGYRYSISNKYSCNICYNRYEKEAHTEEIEVNRTGSEL